MLHCEYCNAPLLSMTTVCPNCHREQPPFPPVLPGGGGRSYRGWASIIAGIGVGLWAIAIATFFQSPYSNVAGLIYGSPSVYVSTGQAQYLMVNGAPIYSGYGYLIFFGGIGTTLLLWAFISYNRGNRIDKANAAIIRAMRATANER